MIEGFVTDERVPIIDIEIASVRWLAVIDTGFNGDLELPQQLAAELNARYVGRISALLAAGQRIEEDLFLVDFPFDGQVRPAQAMLSDGAEILLGTNLLRNHRLIVDFVAGSVLIEGADDAATATSGLATT